MTNTKEQKRAHWGNVIKEWKASGESQSHYCRLHNIKPHQLTYWAQISKPKPPAERPANPKGFVALQVTDTQPTGLTLRLPSGLQLEGVTTRNLSVVREIIGWTS
jgi:hypothetical protein